MQVWGKTLWKKTRILQPEAFGNPTHLFTAAVLLQKNPRPNSEDFII